MILITSLLMGAKVKLKKPKTGLHGIDLVMDQLEKSQREHLERMKKSESEKKEV